MHCKIVRQFMWTASLLVVSFSFSYRTFAQESSAKTAQRALYRSDVDDQLTVEKVSVLPFTDNLQGIYARPLEAHFITLVDQMHRWDYVASSASGAILSPEELETSPDKTKNISQGLGVDGVFAARISKGPNGVNIHLSFLLTRDGKLFAQAVIKEYKQFDLADLKEQMQKMLVEVVARIPYAGRVLSRDANRVTLNLGRKDGLQPNQMLSVIQFIQVQRHPKFNFIISTEKEIFGKIKILKVDDTLSFGIVVTEKEKGAIQKNAKIGPLDYITYANTDSLSLTPSPEETLGESGDGKIAFGKDPKEWKPTSQPSFGQVGGRFGLNQFTGNTNITGVGGLESKNKMAPSVQLDGEIWVTPEWTFHARLRQGMIPVDNPRSGSQPSELSQRMSYYEAVIGYSIRMGPYNWSPYVEPVLGYMAYELFVDDSSPRAFTTTRYSGFKYGVRGAFPIGPMGEYSVGGEFAMVWKPALSESPSSSGGSNNSATQFGVFGTKRLSERLRALVGLDYEMYSTNFSGGATTSLSHRYTTLSGGVYYMF